MIIKIIKESEEDSEEEQEEETPEPPKEIVVHLDQEKRQIPEDLVEFWLEANAQCKALASIINQLQALMKETHSDKDPIWKQLNISHWNMHIRNLRSQIKFARPWAVCPICGGDGGVVAKGKKKGNCKTCKGQGWLIFRVWQAVPGDQK